MTHLSEPATTTSAAAPGKSARLRWLSAAADKVGPLAQRFGFMLLVLLALIYLTYLGLELARGAPLAPTMSLALTRSAVYAGDLLQGDLGQTAPGAVSGRSSPVSQALPELVARSFGLLAFSLALATLAGVLLGLLAALRRRSHWATAIIALSVIGISVPSFFAAPLLQMLLIQWTRTFGSPLLPMGGFGWDSHIILPALVLAARPIAQITRVTYVSLTEVMAQDFVRVATSKGLRPYAVLWRHIGRNVAIPILTTVGLSLRFSLSSLPVVEYFFGWPGIGFTLLKAISQRDDRLTIALLLCLALLLMTVNLLLEWLYPRIDPRLKLAREQRISRRREPLLTRLKDFWADARQIIADNPINRRLHRQAVDAPPPPVALKPDATLSREANRRIAAERRRALLRGTLGNPPFVIGGLIVLALLAVVLWGPQLSPHSPFTTQGLEIENGQFSVPPFAPDETYPWGTDILGRDLMSLIFAGAQQTLLLAAVVVLARMVIGALLGLLAGWASGSWFDRLVLSASEIIAAVPTLLLAMILIVGLGIRQGLPPFIIALCFVGWGEVMQFVRGQMLSLRPRLFIESAVAVGLRTPRIVVGHVLPNLLPALISLAALEMGAVLILLGELGFIGIFIGGGSLAEVTGVGLYHYSDVPEWGALLSNLRSYARAYAWTAIYPTGAFFIAILGFNLFGEGIRRLVDDVGVHVTSVVNRYSVGAVALLLVGFGWAQQNTGLMVYYRQQANTFSGDNALAWVQHLSQPEFEGRALGSPGLARATDYLVDEFTRLGVQSAGQKTTYLYERSRSYQQLDALPRLQIDDGGPAPLYLEDFSTAPSVLRNLGEAHGPVRVMATGPLNMPRGFSSAPPRALRGISYEDEILLVFSARDAVNLGAVPHAGMLVVAEDDADLRRNTTVYSRDPSLAAFGRRTVPDRPILWISRATADRILAQAGVSVDELELKANSLLEDELLDVPTPATVSLAVAGTVIDKTPAAHVIGYIPGTAGLSERTGQLNSQMIIVMAQYDSPPLNPDGQPRPAANDNASGVAVLLEAIRTMQESGYEPYKTFLFVAYPNEGMEGGEVVQTPDPSKLLQARSSFGSNFDVEAVVDLRGLGAGSGNGLALSTSGSQRLAGLFESAARQAGVSTTRVDEPVDLRMVFENTARGQGQEAPQIGLSWAGWEASSGTPQDTPQSVSADRLEKAGRTLSLALMILGRETEY